MSWFGIIKYSIASNLEQMFPKAKVKLMGNMWSILFNNEQEYQEAFEFFTDLQERGDFEFGYGFNKNKKWWRITFPNRELKEME